jgi:hypothetical protein
MPLLSFTGRNSAAAGRASRQRRAWRLLEHPSSSTAGRSPGGLRLLGA